MVGLRRERRAVGHRDDIPVVVGDIGSTTGISSGARGAQGRV